MVAVALLPLQSTEFSIDNLSQLRSTPFVVPKPDSDIRWITHVSAYLAQTKEPLILVFAGESCVHAPAIGFSRKSLRRPAIHYILVNPTQLPAPSSEYSDWPDAPVTIVINAEQETDYADIKWQASLRGWKTTSRPLTEFLNDVLPASLK